MGKKTFTVPKGGQKGQAYMGKGKVYVPPKKPQYSNDWDAWDYTPPTSDFAKLEEEIAKAGLHPAEKEALNAASMSMADFAKSLKHGKAYGMGSEKLSEYLKNHPPISFDAANWQSIPKNQEGGPYFKFPGALDYGDAGQLYTVGYGHPVEPVAPSVPMDLDAILSGKSQPEQPTPETPMPPKTPKKTAYLRCIGGPMDGKLHPVDWPLDHFNVGIDKLTFPDGTKGMKIYRVTQILPLYANEKMPSVKVVPLDELQVAETVLVAEHHSMVELAGHIIDHYKIGAAELGGESLNVTNNNGKTVKLTVSPMEYSQSNLDVAFGGGSGVIEPGPTTQQQHRAWLAQQLANMHWPFEAGPFWKKIEAAQKYPNDAPTADIAMMAGALLALKALSESTSPG